MQKSNTNLNQMLVSYINNINTLGLLKNIEEYNKIDLKDILFDDLSIKLREIISDFFVTTTQIKSGTNLFRIRKLKDLVNIPQNFDDIWYPKAFFLKNGRVNRKEYPVLYTSLDMLTPIFECGIEENDYYAIIQYKVTKDINASLIVNDKMPEGLNETGEINLRIINNFVTTEFCKPVGSGTEFLYKTTILLCEDIFDLPNCDAYCYPSIARFKKGYNLALKGKAADNKLTFECVAICKRAKYIEENNSYSFHLIKKAILNDDKTLKYIF